MGLATTGSEAHALPKFTLGGEECGVNILAGVDNLRGGVPIIDMRIRSSRAGQAMTSSRLPSFSIPLIRESTVDSVPEAIAATREQLQPMPPASSVQTSSTSAC